MKKIILSAVFVITALIAGAQEKEIFAPGGNAVKGYDVVAFFTDAKPVKGNDSIYFNYMNARWLFASRAHLDSFRANPERYMPQYGGYCAYGTAQGHKAPTETETWSIVNGKLYFNYNMKVKNLWLGNQPSFIEQADKQWPLIKDK